MKSPFPLSALFVFAAGLVACGPAQDVSEQSADDLTSLTAVEKTVSFDSYLDVPASMSDTAIEQAVHTSLRVAFGAFRTNQVGLNDRELHGNLDPKAFIKVPMTLVSGTTSKNYVRVKYHYTDRAVVPVSLSSRSTFGLATLAADYQSRIGDVLDKAGCSDGGHETTEFRADAWYIFNPTTYTCQRAIGAEQKAIATERAALRDASKLGPVEAQRLFFPTIATFTSVAGAPTEYPEYDRLWGIGSTKTKFVVQGINGQLADWADPNATRGLDDEGYHEFMKQLRVILAGHPELKLVSSENVDLVHYNVGGTAVSATWGDLFAWELDGNFPAAARTASARQTLRQNVYDNVFQHQLIFQAPFTVSTAKAKGSKKPNVSKTVTLEVRMYYGDDGSSSEPFRAAFGDADVFVYNGHSYIGHGPMDPGNFSASDFPNKYQIFVFDSCVSFNYYEKGFFEMHPGGSKNLDVITNGLESATSDSGGSMGRLIATLIDGKGKSYTSILKAAQFQEGWGSGSGDALRVVDGELDNAWTPATKPMTVTAK